MARPKSPIPRERIHLYLPRDLVSHLDLMVSDPLTGQPVHGARSKIVELLLTDALDAFRKGSPTLDLDPLRRHLVSYLRGGKTA